MKAKATPKLQINYLVSNDSKTITGCRAISLNFIQKLTTLVFSLIFLSMKPMRFKNNSLCMRPNLQCLTVD